MMTQNPASKHHRTSSIMNSSSHPLLLTSCSLSRLSLALSLLIICCQGKPNLLLSLLARAKFARLQFPSRHGYCCYYSRLVVSCCDSIDCEWCLACGSDLWIVSGSNLLRYKKAACEGKSSGVASLQFQVGLSQVPIRNSWKCIAIFPLSSLDMRNSSALPSIYQTLSSLTFPDASWAFN